MEQPGSPPAGEPGPTPAGQPGQPAAEPAGRPVLAGILTALVGFTSSFAVVLAGLRGVGATPAEAASGLLAVCATQGLGILWLVRRHRIPLTLAWSTPGAAVLASTGVVRGGWPAAVGAFAVAGGLIVITGLWPRLGRLISAIPTPIAQAMLAGVVLELCLVPVRGFVAHPGLVGPILLTWALMLRFARKWAVPAAFAVTLVVIGVEVARRGGLHGAIVPHLIWTAPVLTVPGLLSLAIPLYIVTMAGQNVPGVAIMASYGYRVPWRETMTVTGLGTAAGAMAGGHAINLAAITASMAASPDADPDPGRRWIASWTSGWAYLVLAVVSTALTVFISAAPSDLAGAVAGLALLGTLSSALAGALSATEGREAAAITFVVAASGLSFLGIGAAFWALAAGLAVHAVLPRSRTGRLRGLGGRSGQRGVVAVPDLVDPLGELPAVAGAPVPVVVDGVVQFAVAVAGADQFLHVGPAGRGVAVQLDGAGVGGLHQEVHELRHPGPPGPDLVRADQLGRDVGHPQRAVRGEQRRHPVVVAHHRPVGELTAQRLDLDAVGDGLQVGHGSHSRMKTAWTVTVALIEVSPSAFQVIPKSARLIRTRASRRISPLPLPLPLALASPWLATAAGRDSGRVCPRTVSVPASTAPGSRSRMPSAVKVMSWWWSLSKKSADRRWVSRRLFPVSRDAAAITRVPRTRPSGPTVPPPVIWPNRPFTGISPMTLDFSRTLDALGSRTHAPARLPLVSRPCSAGGASCPDDAGMVASLSSQRSDEETGRSVRLTPWRAVSSDW
jgi:benzoate membrane transport protein